MSEAPPWEFTPEAVEASREGAFEPYKSEMRANNALPATFLQNNPWLATPEPGSELVFGEFYEPGSEFEGYPKKYYDTLPMEEHPYYKDLEYPKPTKDIQRLRHDLYDWGFCLIEDAMTPAQTERFRSRVGHSRWRACIRHSLHLWFFPDRVVPCQQRARVRTDHES